MGKICMIPVSLFVEADSAYEAYKKVFNAMEKLYPEIDWQSHDDSWEFGDAGDEVSQEEIEEVMKKFYLNYFERNLLEDTEGNR
jgi:hypothetical protein